MIRPMELKDVAAVAEIETVCFSDPWSSEVLKAGLLEPLDTYFVAGTGGGVWGYAALRVIGGEGEILRIAVVPHKRNQGIGKKLMDAMVAFARSRKVSAVTLEVRSGNKGAVKLYESYGFEEEGVRTGYYINPKEDALILWNRFI